MKNASQIVSKKPKDIKLLALLYGISFVLNFIVIIYATITFGPTINFFSYNFVIMYVSLAIVLVIIFGLLKYAKWGLYLAFGFSMFHVIFGLINIDIIRIAIHSIILYYLYKWRASFK
jgi:uncharacterized membrane protein